MPSAGMLQGEMKANSICISSVTLDVFPFPFRLEFTHTHTHTHSSATELPSCQLLLPGVLQKSPLPTQSSASPRRRASIHSPSAASRGVGKEQSGDAVAHRRRGCALHGTHQSIGSNPSAC